MTCITSITTGTACLRSLRSFAVNTLICQICEARASTDAVHLADISVRSGGAGFSRPQRGPRTSVRLPRVSHDLGEVGLKPAAD
jgi:hypothetical protein